jgi:hypothetical protein
MKTISSLMTARKNTGAGGSGGSPRRARSQAGSDQRSESGAKIERKQRMQSR